MATKLYIGNLPHDISDSALNDFVVNAGFEVASAVVIRDKMSGQTRGFGFVELAKNEDVPRAIGSLNGRDFDGRALTVNEARPLRTASSAPGSGRGRDTRRRDY